MVPRFCDYSSIPDKYAAYRNFACCERLFCLILPFGTFEFVSMDESVLEPHHDHGLLHPFQMFAAVHLKFMDMGVVSF